MGSRAGSMSAAATARRARGRARRASGSAACPDGARIGRSRNRRRSAGASRQRRRSAPGRRASASPSAGARRPGRPGRRGRCSCTSQASVCAASSTAHLLVGSRAELLPGVVGRRSPIDLPRNGSPARGRTPPSRALMPYSVTIAFAILVAWSMSLTRRWSARGRPAPRRCDRPWRTPGARSSPTGSSGPCRLRGRPGRDRRAARQGSANLYTG